MKRAWLLALVVCVGLLWFGTAPAAAGGRHHLLAAIFAGPSYQAAPPGAPFGPLGPPRYPGYGLGAPTYPWGYFGACCTRPTVVRHTGYYNEFVQWGYRWGY